MSVIALITVPAATFELGRLFQDFPGTSIRLERVVSSENSLIPYFWTLTDQFVPLVRRFETSPLIDEVTVIDETEMETLFRVEWAKEPDALLTVIGDAGGTVLNGNRTGDTWSFELRFTDRDSLSAFFCRCDETDLDVSLKSISPSEAQRDGAAVSLSTEQIQIVQRALEEGYYEVPQQATLSELSSTLDRSEDAVAAQLHEVEATVLESVL